MPALIRHASALACATAFALFGAAPLAHAHVFINELHYDNLNSDTGEALEIVATQGESLSGYRLYLYNGSSPTAATSYSNAAVPAGSVTSCGGSVRIAKLAYPADGIQNGANDGLALVDAAGKVVQFLSYEGQIKAASGPAAGLISQTIPVSESNSTPVGTSLQLRGSGSAAGDFTWAASSVQSFGACNTGQSFSGGGPADPVPSVLSTAPVAGATDFPVAGDLAATFSESVTAGSGAFALSCASSGTVPLTHAASASSFTIATGKLLQAGESCTFTINAAAIADSAGQRPASGKSINFQVAAQSNTGYYRRVNASSASQLRCSLHATIKDHTSYPYSGGTTNTWTILEIADEDPSNAGRILDIYRNRSYAKVADRAGGGTGIKYNREHTWPKSLGFSSATGDKGLPYAPHTDTHMLYLSDADWNSSRGNKPYANCANGCSERVTEAYLGVGGGSGRYPGNSNWVVGSDGNSGSFETWWQRKGDVARAVLYMAIRYEGGRHSATGQSEPDLELTDDRNKIVMTSASPAYMGLLSTLLQWHQADPPDARERERNEVIFNFQGNRNPFIDHPEWATQALFTSAKPSSCQLAN